jgi:hypothetical protein
VIKKDWRKKYLMEFKNLTKYLFIGILFFTSCKTGSKVFKSHANISEIEKLAIQVAENEIDYNTFKGRAKINIETPDLKQSATLYIRIKNDSIVWGSVTALLGLEIVRFYATHEKLVMLSKFENKAYIYSYYQVEEMFGISDVDLEFIENLFIGKPLFDIDNSCEFTQNESQYVINKNDDILQRQMQINEFLQVFRYDIIHNVDNKKATILYSGQMKEGNRQIPENIIINASLPELNSMEINYQSINFDKSLKFNTSIPESYEIIE